MMALSIPSVVLIQTHNNIWLSVNKTVIHVRFSQHFSFIFCFLKLPQFRNSRPDALFEKGDLEGFLKIHRKTPAMESSF